MLFLRARWYTPGSGIFLSRDPWEGDDTRPQSLNGWSYVEGNPINRRDPSGKVFCPYGVDPETGDCAPSLWGDATELPPWFGGIVKQPPIILPGPGLIRPLIILLLASGCYYAAEELTERWTDARVDTGPQPEPKPTVACCPPQPSPTPQQYDVLVQVQGKKLRVGGSGISIALQDTSPIKASNVIGALNTLQGSLTRRDGEKTDEAFHRARTWVNRVAAAGGIGPIGNTPFNNRDISPNDARVDIQVNRGPINIVP